MPQFRSGQLTPIADLLKGDLSSAGVIQIPSLKNLPPPTVEPEPEPVVEEEAPQPKKIAVRRRGPAPVITETPAATTEPIFEPPVMAVPEPTPTKEPPRIPIIPKAIRPTAAPQTVAPKIDFAPKTPPKETPSVPSPVVTITPPPPPPTMPPVRDLVKPKGLGMGSWVLGLFLGLAVSSAIILAAFAYREKSFAAIWDEMELPPISLALPGAQPIFDRFNQLVDTITNLGQKSEEEDVAGANASRSKEVFSPIVMPNVIPEEASPAAEPNEASSSAITPPITSETDISIEPESPVPSEEPIPETPPEEQP